MDSCQEDLKYQGNCVGSRVQSGILEVKTYIWHRANLQNFILISSGTTFKLWVNCDSFILCSLEENEFLSVWKWKFGLKIFFEPLEYQKKMQIFKKKMKKHHSGELHRKDTILNQAQQITLFFTLPVYMFRTWRNTVREFMGIFISLFIQRRELNLSPGVKLISWSWTLGDGSLTDHHFEIVLVQLVKSCNHVYY